MIGTFWNLCRACPSMPVDKLHSEYRSTYRWHEYTGPRQEVVRKPPQPITELSVTGAREEEVTKNAENAPTTQSGGIEPAMPRRKKYPTLAYRSNDFITSKTGETPSRHVSTSLDRARCAERERERASRRSKSEGPPNGPTSPISPSLEYGAQRVLRSDSDPSEFAQQLMISGYPQESNHSGGLKSAISRISTEYRFQFAWPRGLKPKEEEETGGAPRKSLSMGAIKPTANTGPPPNTIPPPAPVHKKRITQADKLDGSAELEPLVSDQDGVEYSGEEKIQEESLSKEEKPQLRAEFKTEYKKKFRPFSQYDYVEGRFKPKRDEPEPEIVPDLPHGDSWFREVLELRKKAGEYKHRGWGTELVPEHIAELYNKQMSLWEQVSRRSSLSALSLASSTHRSISKEEKEKENNKKSSPTKYPWPRTTTKSMPNKTDKTDDYKKEIPPRTRVDNIIRHHLERTTGSGEEGILQSPTREKLEPAIPRRKETTTEANKSPQKTQQHTTGRSQSVGPNTTYPENRSPKRTPRAAQNTPKTAQVITTSEKKPRPTTLPTAPSRTKPLTGSVKVSEAKTKATQGIRKAKENSSPNTNKPKESKEKTADEVETSEAEVIEAVVKSPPEPTRVKSPEQILIRSPEPVNWTVPLDTGKTFTVTQNVCQGDSICRPQSESRMVTAITHPPPAPPQSAPPQLQQDSGTKNDKDEETTPLSCEKPVAGTTLRCLDDPSFSFDSGQQEQRSLSTDIMEKARTRFDQFWGKSNQDNTEKEEHL